MKHYFAELKYLVPVEQLADILPLHRAFLQTGYDKGWLLISGPKVPRTGGFVVARAPSLEDLQDFFKNDPYQINHVAEYTFTEFQPVKHQEFLTDWVSE